MMGVTHIYIGTMSAVLLTELESPCNCLAAMIGGSLGGIFCDLDLGNCRSEAWRARVHACLLTGFCLMIDLFFDMGLLRNMLLQNTSEQLLGTTGLLCLGCFAMTQPHRGWAHSVGAAAAAGFCAELVCPGLGFPFLAGMGSHILLDLLNRKPLQLFWPIPGGYCLGICRVGGQPDRLLWKLGVFGTVLFIGIAIGQIHG